MPAVPKSRPQITRAEAVKLIRAKGLDPTKPVVMGIRGYYLDSQGKPGANDRGFWDDAFVVMDEQHFETFNGNTDPTSYRKATASRKGMATLKPGVWQYKPGIHGLSKPKDRQYSAFVQAQAVTVARDGGKDDTGWHGINIHRGGNTTSSLGCQTVPPAQWGRFHEFVNNLLNLHGLDQFPYLLITEEWRRGQK